MRWDEKHMMNDNRSVRAGGGPTPHITISGGRAADAIAFYEKAFGARLLSRILAEDGHRILIAILFINGGNLALSDEFPETGCATGQTSPTQRVAGVVLHLQVEDADTWWEMGLEAGAEIAFPLGVQFWGDCYGQLLDPFGYVWSIGSLATKH